MAGRRGLCLLPLLLLLLCALLAAAAPGGERRSASCRRWVLEPWARLGSAGGGRALPGSAGVGVVARHPQLRRGLRAEGLQAGGGAGGTAGRSSGEARGR